MQKAIGKLVEDLVTGDSNSFFQVIHSLKYQYGRYFLPLIDKHIKQKKESGEGIYTFFQTDNDGNYYCGEF